VEPLIVPQQVQEERFVIAWLEDKDHYLAGTAVYMTSYSRLEEK
jgi:hypothetical protein